MNLQKRLLIDCFDAFLEHFDDKFLYKDIVPERVFETHKQLFNAKFENNSILCMAVYDLELNYAYLSPQEKIKRRDKVIDVETDLLKVKWQHQKENDFTMNRFSHMSLVTFILLKKIVNSSFKHFIRKDLIAEGNFGVVYKVQHRTTMSLYAMKEVSIATERTKKQFLNEVNVHEIMKSAHAAFTVPLLCTFQTPPLESGAFGYMVFPLMSGGDFSDFLSAHQKREKPLLESEVRFYAANMILAIEELHNHNIIHADIKPENFLLGDDGYLKLTDFGLSTILGEKKVSLDCCGTKGYIAPEVADLVKKKEMRCICEEWWHSLFAKAGYNTNADWWSMGIIIYKMFGGKTEQSNENRKTSSPELLADNYGITEGTSSESLVHNSESLQLLENTKPVVINISTNWPKDAQDLLKNLLNTNYRKRLGVKGAEQIKKHPFFKETNWETLREKQVVAPVWPVMHKDIIIYTETITGQTFPSY